MGVAALLSAALLAVTPASYVGSRQQADGGFAEPGSSSTPGLTAWAMLGLRSAGRSSGAASDYLAANEQDLQSATDIELALMAEAATGRISETLYARFAALVRQDGRIGPAINSTAWGILASAQVGRPVRLRVSYLLTPPASIGRVGLDRGRLTGLQRHGRGHPGAPHTGRSRAADRAGNRLSPPPAKRRRRLRAHRRARLRRSVDGLGDPGLRRGARHATGARVSLSRRAPARGRELSLFA